MERVRMKHLKKIMPFFMIGIVSLLMGNSQQETDGIMLKDYPVLLQQKNRKTCNLLFCFQKEHLIKWKQQ